MFTTGRRRQFFQRVQQTQRSLLGIVRQPSRKRRNRLPAVAVVATLAETLEVPQLASAENSASVSWELRDAPNAETTEQRVFLWLQKHHDLIVQAETRLQVDRRAIAGVIAWEALENLRTESEFQQLHSRGSRAAPGPGKVHYKQGHFLEGDPASRQIEGTSLYRQDISRKSPDERFEYLSTIPGAVEYIGEMFHAYSTHFERAGYLGIRWHPEILGTLHQGASIFTDNDENFQQMEAAICIAIPTIFPRQPRAGMNMPVLGFATTFPG